MDQGLFANLHAYVQINPALAPIAERLQLKRLVPMAVDQAIVEIITPVVERSVTIACMTAQELIVKVHALPIRTICCPHFQVVPGCIICSCLQVHALGEGMFVPDAHFGLVWPQDFVTPCTHNDQPVLSWLIKALQEESATSEATTMTCSTLQVDESGIADAPTNETFRTITLSLWLPTQRTLPQMKCHCFVPACQAWPSCSIPASWHCVQRLYYSRHT